MRKTVIRIIGPLLLIVAFLCPSVFGITWFDKDFDCPVCKTKNTFMVWGSYGSYIYHDPSRFQYIFWPLTDSPVVYTCKKCHLSVFMWDFEKLPADKLPVIAKELEKVKLEGEYKKYTDIPMTRRLEIAEQVYSVLGKDDDFWCRFYRVMGYHYDEKDQVKADAARTKALGLATKMREDKNNTVQQKELLYISGAMKHFLKNDKGAIEDLNKAINTKFFDKSLKDEENKNGEENFSFWSKELIDLIQGKQKASTATTDAER